jgi:uncharacterized membrane protein YgcG
LIQLTGRTNYGSVSKIVGQDLIAHPELVEQFPLALTVSGIYWRTRPVKGGLHLNDLADQNDYRGVTRNINGNRMLALIDRTTLTKRAYALLQSDRTYGPRTDAGSDGSDSDSSSGSGSDSNDDSDGSNSGSGASGPIDPLPSRVVRLDTSSLGTMQSP